MNIINKLIIMNIIAYVTITVANVKILNFKILMCFRRAAIFNGIMQILIIFQLLN